MVQLDQTVGEGETYASAREVVGTEDGVLLKEFAHIVGVNASTLVGDCNIGMRRGLRDGQLYAFARVCKLKGIGE